MLSFGKDVLLKISTWSWFRNCTGSPWQGLAGNTSQRPPEMSFNLSLLTFPLVGFFEETEEDFFMILLYKKEGF